MNKIKIWYMTTLISDELEYKLIFRMIVDNKLEKYNRVAKVFFK